MSQILIHVPRQFDRWFVLDTEAGTLAYHLMDERHLKSRGTQHLSGSVVIPSDEDSVTFSVSFASGDVYKVHGTLETEPIFISSSCNDLS